MSHSWLDTAHENVYIRLSDEASSPVVTFIPPSLKISFSQIHCHLEVYCDIDCPGVESALFPPAPTTIPRSLYSDLPGQGGEKPLRGKRLGVHFAWVDSAQPEVRQAFKQMLRLMADLGCKVKKAETENPLFNLAAFAM